MNNVSMCRVSFARAVWICLVGAHFLNYTASTIVAAPYPEVTAITAEGVVQANWNGEKATLHPGERLGEWTLMAVVRTGQDRPCAAFEDFSIQKGRLIFVDERGLRADLPKSLEPTFAEPSTLYHGHRLADVLDSNRDLLGDEILAKPGDPEYSDVAACFAPISKMQTYTFVGTQECIDKVGLAYGGRTPNFDPAVYVPAIDAIRDQGHVLDGLVGGWLPVVRFVYPEQSGDWSEMIAYAPLRVDNGNPRVQPVWYRIARIENNALRWVRYFDTYHPFPPRPEAAAEPFYADLLTMRAGWEHALAPGMQIDLPDQRLADMARHCLVRDMITRVGAFPKYGVFERNYGGSEHDGFPDTFNADTTAMLEWGLFDPARQYIDNYFTYFVRDDGSILYRGPETGQFGRILTVLAEYANDTGDLELLLRHQPRIDALTRLLLSLRARALALPTDHPAHGMIAGWSEADACLDPDPQRYMCPYFSNSTEAARGFGDLGEVWERVGRQKNLPERIAWGQKLRQEGRALAEDVQTSIGRSILADTTPPCLPAIAGVKEPFHVAVARDKLDPLFRSYRPYMEMLYSGNLTRDQVKMIVDYRAAHRDIVLGVPTCYGFNTHELAGFLSYGHGYGLLQHDMVRESLLTLYSLMAHQYTRGTWTAPETRLLDPKRPAAPYCTPAQLVVPLMTRWMLVFEDPATQTLWLAKGTPRSWLEEAKGITVSHAPTRWGAVGYRITPRWSESQIAVHVDLPDVPPLARITLRLRVPENHRMQAVTLNGKPWTDFNPQDETVTLPSDARGSVTMAVQY